jgi:hypothetical protein
MRYSKKAGSRTLAMLMDEAIPRRSDGALNLCANCQRWMWFAGGYVKLLIGNLEASARIVALLRRGFMNRVKSLEIGGTFQWRTSHREAAAGIVREVAFAEGKTLRCQRWSDGRVFVWRLA